MMRPRPSRYLTGVLLLTLMAASCDVWGDDRVEVRGSGRVVTEMREVSGFDEIVLRGFGDVVVEVTGSESLSIEAEDNIMPFLTTEVVSGRLELGSGQDGERSLSPTRDVTFSITAAELVGVSVLGSGSFAISRVETDAFSASISGSGAVVSTGTCDALSVDISGSGSFAGEDLLAVAGSVSISGSGSAVVNVTDELAVSLSGSGSVEYLGDPTVAPSISGSGEVRPH
jgi:hypothetical protein